MRHSIEVRLETEGSFDMDEDVEGEGGKGIHRGAHQREDLAPELSEGTPRTTTLKTLTTLTTLTTEFSVDRRGKSLAKELALFAHYRKTKNMQDLDAIVRNYQGLVRSLACRFRGRGAELDDLVQAAQIGLLLSIDRFDAECGVPFVGFATATILGELRKYFRTLWSVHMPRSLQESTQLLGSATSELQQELGRLPSLAELADRTGIPCVRLREVTAAAGAFRSRSLDAPLFAEDGESLSLHESVQSVDAGSAFEAVDARQAVESLLNKLTSRSRKIVELHFYQERSQREIAELVGLSQMQVSRLLRQAMRVMSSPSADKGPTEHEGLPLAA
jgi:RNA polymerase sigma-B factor